MWTILSPWSKQSHGCSCQGCKATNHTGTLRNSPEPSEPCLRNLHQHTQELLGTLRNNPNPASGTYTNTRRNSPEPSGAFRDLSEPTFRNLSEPSRTYLLNLRQHTPEPSKIFRNLPPEPTPELSGTFRNLPPEPTPAHAGTLRNLPEPSSGTCSCDPHRHTPELFWAEDPISLRCWGKNNPLATSHTHLDGPVSISQNYVPIASFPTSTNVLRKQCFITL